MEPDIVIPDLDTCFAWEIGLLLLSLNRVVPLWGELGLSVADPEQILPPIRAFVGEQQRLAETPDESYPVRFASLLRRLFARVAECGGDEVTRRLRRWLEHDFMAYQRTPRWREVWRSLLTRIDASQEPVLVRLAMPPEKARRLVELSDRWAQASDAVDETVERAERVPLVGWDEEQYHLYQRESTLISPLDYLSSHLRAARFAGVWDQIRELLNPSELEVLNTWGQITAVTQTTIPPASAEIPVGERGGP